jgi:hypothetical protein
VSRYRRLFAAGVIATALVGACGGNGDGGTVIAVVIDVTGDLTSVDQFVVRLPDGTDQVIEPAPGIRFHGDAAITHIRDHLRSGAPVRITYDVLDDGTWIARGVEDAGEG